MSNLPYNFNLRDWIQKAEDKFCCMGTYMDSPVMMSYNGTTGELTLTDQNGLETIINLPLEQFLSSASYNDTTNILTLTMSDATTFDVNLSDLVDTLVVPGGSDTQIQYNNAGAFAGSSQLVANIGATNTLDITGSGSTSATNALRVRNSSGTQIMNIDDSGSTYYSNNSPIYFKRADNVIIGQIISTNAGLVFGSNTASQFTLENGGSVIIGNITKANYPSLLLNGTGYSGGTATTTKPTLLIEPTGTTSTGWSTNGTKFGVNAESGFTGNLLDLKTGGVSKFSITNTGVINISDLTNPNTYVNINGTDKQDILKVKWGSGASNYIGFGSNTANNPVINMGLAQISSHPTGSSLWITPYRFGNNTSGIQFEVFSNLTGTQTGNCITLTSASRVNATHHNPTSGVYNMVMVGGADTNQYMDWSPSSGTATFNSLSITQQLNTSNSYSGIVRGLYYSPILTSITGITHRAIETETGDVLFNTTSGSTIIGTATVNPNAKFEVVSISKGFLPPRMTTTQRDAVTWVAGDAGMMIFNRDLVKLQVWNGTAWETVTSV